MTILIFLVILSVLVLVHEIGHFFTARMFGVKAQEFGYGFPPRVMGWTRISGAWKRVPPKDDAEYPNTIWSINWLPFGGFVRIKGEQPDGVNDADSIHAKPIWQRVVILAAGVTMNWLLAIALFMIVFASGTLTLLQDLPSGAHVTDRQTLVTEVLPSSPASEAGVKTGDALIAVNGKVVTSADAIRAAIIAAGTTEVDLTIRRDHTERDLHMTPRIIDTIHHPAIGVALGNAGIVSFSIPQAFIEAVRYTATLTVEIVQALGGILRDLVVTHNVSNDVSGPVGIAVLTGRVARQGWMALLYFSAYLSVNLAIINLLPIPALDGGRIFFLIIEKVRRKPMNRTLEIKINNIAFLILILLILLVTVRDVMHLIR